MKIKIYNDHLEPNFWNEDMTLKRDVRLRLLKIVNDFYKSTEFKSEMIDVLLLGSIVNFNWLPESDADLHIVIDIKKEGLDPEHYRKTLDCLGNKWNMEHDIKIFGHPVEVYIQDITEKNSTIEKARAHASIFSLLKNKWLIPPKKEKISLDKEEIKKKFYEIKDEIDKVVKDKNIDGLKSLMKKIREYRNKGLEGPDGEFSTENIVFKALRHTGILETLKNTINTLYDKLVSINEEIEYYRNIVVPDPNFMDSIIEETMSIFEEMDKPYVVIGTIDDNLKIIQIKCEKIDKLPAEYLSYQNHITSHNRNDIDHDTAVYWVYRSDINEIICYDYLSEDQLNKIKNYLLDNFKILSIPNIVYDLNFNKMSFS